MGNFTCSPLLLHANHFLEIISLSNIIQGIPVHAMRNRRTIKLLKA